MRCFFVISGFLVGEFLASIENGQRIQKSAHPGSRPALPAQPMSSSFQPQTHDFVGPTPTGVLRPSKPGAPKKQDSQDIPHPLSMTNNGTGPNTVSGSAVSNTELSEFFRAH